MTGAALPLRRLVDVQLARIHRALPLGSHLMLVVQQPGALPIVRLPSAADEDAGGVPTEADRHVAAINRGLMQRMDQVPDADRVEVTLRVLAAAASGFIAAQVPELRPKLKGWFDRIVEADLHPHDEAVAAAEAEAAA